MKKIKFKSLILICMCLALVFQTNAQKVTKQKNIDKTFKVSSATTLNIENKFGKVHINTDNSNAIQVNIAIIGKGSTDEKAQGILDRVVINIDESGSQISFKTSFNNSLSGSLDRMTSSLNNNKNSDYEVNYVVSMPKNTPLTLKNSFGETYLASHTGDLNLTVSYGNLKADNLTGNTTKNISVSFGNGDIDYVEQGDIKVSYGKLALQKGKQLTLKNSFSKTQIGELDDLNIESKYGDFKIDKLNQIEGSSSFSGFEIGSLGELMKMTTKYDGNFKVNQISSNFKEIYIDAQFSSVYLDIDESASFKFDVEAKFGDLKMDKSKANINKEVHTHTSATYSGTYGNSNTNAKLSATVKYGNLHIK